MNWTDEALESFLNQRWDIIVHLKDDSSLPITAKWTTTTTDWFVAMSTDGTKYSVPTHSISFISEEEV